MQYKRTCTHTDFIQWEAVVNILPALHCEQCCRHPFLLLSHSGNGLGRFGSSKFLSWYGDTQLP